jgi:hypothetical protein
MDRSSCDRQLLPCPNDCSNPSIVTVFSLKVACIYVESPHFQEGVYPITAGFDSNGSRWSAGDRGISFSIGELRNFLQLRVHFVIHFLNQKNYAHFF